MTHWEDQENARVVLMGFNRTVDKNFLNLRTWGDMCTISKITTGWLNSSTLAWKIPWSLVGCSPWGCWGSDTTEQLHFHFSLSCIGEGNGNPLQCSCLENPRDGGAWWAAVYGVAQSWTRLKRLSSSSSSSSGCFKRSPSYLVRLNIFTEDIDENNKERLIKCVITMTLW